GEVFAGLAARTTGAAGGAAGRTGFAGRAGRQAFFLDDFALIGAAGFFFRMTLAAFALGLAVLAGFLWFLAMGSLGKAKIRRTALRRKVGKYPRRNSTPALAPSASSADTD